ncbi:sodium:solute symporter family protein [Castellaniella sp. WN]
MSNQLIVTSIVILYLLGIVLIGFWSSRKISNNDDFLVAGRRLGPVLLAGGLAATEVGGGATLGVVAKAYGTWGMSALWYVMAMAIAFVVLAYMAPIFRRTAVKTAPEFFRKRYGQKNSLVITLILILPMVGFTAVQIIASATILSVMTGWSYALSVAVVTAVTVLYSVKGGMFALSYTDIVQGVLIIFGMALIIPFALSSGGGWTHVVSHIPEAKWSLIDGIGLPTIISITLMYIASFSIGQEVVQRYYSARDEKAAKQASFLTAIAYAIFAFVPALIGLLLNGMVSNGSIDAALINSRGANYSLPLMAMNVLPGAVTGVLFAALISATMSSASSDLLAAGSLFSNDLYKVYIDKEANEDKLMKVTKIVMVLVGILSFIVAVLNVTDIITLLIFSFGLRAAGGFFPYVFGHVWSRASAAGSMASLVLGSTALVLADLKIVPTFGLDPLYIGLAVGGLCFFGVSLLSKERGRTMILERIETTE